MARESNLKKYYSKGVKRWVAINAFIGGLTALFLNINNSDSFFLKNIQAFLLLVSNITLAILLLFIFTYTLNLTKYENGSTHDRILKNFGLTSFFGILLFFIVLLFGFLIESFFRELLFLLAMIMMILFPVLIAFWLWISKKVTSIKGKIYLSIFIILSQSILNIAGFYLFSPELKFTIYSLIPLLISTIWVFLDVFWIFRKQ